MIGNFIVNPGESFRFGVNVSLFFELLDHVVIEQILHLDLIHHFNDQMPFLWGLALLQLNNCLHDLVEYVLELIGGMGHGIELFLHQLFHIKTIHDFLGYFLVFGCGFDIFMLEGPNLCSLGLGLGLG